MSRLTQDAKRLIVTRLAVFTAHSDIRQELAAQGVGVSLSQIAYYDPSSRGTDVAAEWRTLFERTRAALISETAKAPAAHRAVRVHRLERMAEKAEARSNYKLSAQLLRQIAEEQGNMYVNARGDHANAVSPDEHAARIKGALREMDGLTAPTGPVLVADDDTTIAAPLRRVI